MADQVEIRVPKTFITEETGFTATAYFRTRATGAAATPTTVHYRVDDITSQTTLKDWTSVTTGESVSISITGAMNQIQQNSSSSEHKQLIVQADRGLTTQATGRAIWKVQNIYGININA